MDPIYLLGNRSRAPVQYSCCQVLSGGSCASDDIQIVDDRRTTHIKQIVAQAPIPGTAALPARDMCQGVLDRHTLPQLRPALWALLSLPQSPEQRLSGLDRHAAPLRTPGAAYLERTGGTALHREDEHGQENNQSRAYLRPVVNRYDRLLNRCSSRPVQPRHALSNNVLSPISQTLLAPGRSQSRRCGLGPRITAAG